MVLTQPVTLCTLPLVLVDMFPYHYGSHATPVSLKPSAFDTKRFHTTMVLTQHSEWESEGNRCRSVSIPLWFSRNSAKTQYSTFSKLTVSIPLWFSRNSAMIRRYKNYEQIVSIPLWFSRNLLTRNNPRRPSRVSIPLWFSRNRRRKAPFFLLTRSSFHTTMVLTQPA